MLRYSSLGVADGEPMGALQRQHGAGDTKIRARLPRSGLAPMAGDGGTAGPAWAHHHRPCSHATARTAAQPPRRAPRVPAMAQAAVGQPCHSRDSRATLRARGAARVSARCPRNGPRVPAEAQTPARGSRRASRPPGAPLGHQRAPDTAILGGKTAGSEPTGAFGTRLRPLSLSPAGVAAVAPRPASPPPAYLPPGPEAERGTGTGRGMRRPRAPPSPQSRASRPPPRVAPAARPAQRRPRHWPTLPVNRSWRPMAARQAQWREGREGGVLAEGRGLRRGRRGRGLLGGGRRVPEGPRRGGVRAGCRGSGYHRPPPPRPSWCGPGRFPQPSSSCAGQNWAGEMALHLGFCLSAAPGPCRVPLLRDGRCRAGT